VSCLMRLTEASGNATKEIEVVSSAIGEGGRVVENDGTERAKSKVTASSLTLEAGGREKGTKGTAMRSLRTGGFGWSET
jgi:hypothetical protein